MAFNIFYLNYPFGCSDGITSSVKPSQNPKSKFLIFYILSLNFNFL
nr:MAG TPA: hypothetical protein [Caudoviricetes sp.]